jgi:hypothetical protein
VLLCGVLFSRHWVNFTFTFLILTLCLLNLIKSFDTFTLFIMYISLQTFNVLLMMLNLFCLLSKSFFVVFLSIFNWCFKLTSTSLKINNKLIQVFKITISCSLYLNLIFVCADYSISHIIYWELWLSWSRSLWACKR